MIQRGLKKVLGVMRAIVMRASLNFREFSLGVPTRDLGFGFELAHKPVNTPLPRVCFASLAFFARKLAFYSSSATLLNGKEAIESSRIPRNGRKIGQDSLALSV